MWINKTEFEALQRRVKWLEDSVGKPVEPPTLRDGPDSIYTPYGYQRIWEVEITHDALLRKILSHLGLKLEKIDEVPARVDLVAQLKAKDK